ncbi:MAG: hypothetical protein LBE89_00790 [Helicobacteraceae bacterium]|nr:hypothetical protein [Helicobacteraceae bacterium]
MSYSITKARPKQMLATDTKLWCVFVLSIFLFFFVVKFAFSIYIAALELEIKSNNKTINESVATIRDIEAQISITLQDIEIATHTAARNTAVRKSLTSVLNLVPDQIYLIELTMTEDSLKVKGYSQSPQVFNYMFRPLLDSIFTTSNVSFYSAADGQQVFDYSGQSDAGVDLVK